MSSATEILLERIVNQLKKLVGVDGKTIDTSVHIPLDVNEAWRIARINSVGIGNNKLFQTPPGYEGIIYWIWVELTTSATAGNRQLEIRIENSLGVNVGCLARASTVQATGILRKYLFAPGIADLAALRDTDYLTTPIPANTRVVSGDSIRVLDNKGISAIDTLNVYIQIAYRKV